MNLPESLNSRWALLSLNADDVFSPHLLLTYVRTKHKIQRILVSRRVFFFSVCVSLSCNKNSRIWCENTIDNFECFDESRLFACGRKIYVIHFSLRFTQLLHFHFDRKSTEVMHYNHFLCWPHSFDSVTNHTIFFFTLISL